MKDDPLQTGSPVHFSDALRTFTTRISGSSVALSDIAQFMERRSIGALLLVFALPMVIPIPAPGISVLFGVPLILISAELFLGLAHVWLPSRLAERRIARDSLIQLSRVAAPWLRRIEKIARPRLAWFVDGPATYLSGAACVAMAVIITLPIPLGHFIPGGAVSIIAVGLIERDGLLIAGGLTISLVALVVVTFASSALMDLLRESLGI
jgi:hypothetical protein